MKEPTIKDIEMMLKKWNKSGIGTRRESHRKKVIEFKDTCEICDYKPEDKSQLDRHRIIPHGIFEDSNVAILCKECHEETHRIYNRLKLKDYKMMYFIAKLEIGDKI